MRFCGAILGRTLRRIQGRIQESVGGILRAIFEKFRGNFGQILGGGLGDFCIGFWE